MFRAAFGCGICHAEIAGTILITTKTGETGHLLTVVGPKRLVLFDWESDSATQVLVR